MKCENKKGKGAFNNFFSQIGQKAAQREEKSQILTPLSIFLSR